MPMSSRGVTTSFGRSTVSSVWPDTTPAIVLTASEDPLRDDGERYAGKLIAAGVETLACRLQSLPHGFMALPIGLPAISSAFDLIARMVRSYFDDGRGSGVNSQQ